MYILDTNVLRAIFSDKGQQPNLEARIKQTPYEQLYISIITANEILRGTLELFRNYEKAMKLVEAYRFVEKLLLDLAEFSFSHLTKLTMQNTTPCQQTSAEPVKGTAGSPPPL